jgi:hypothetical protein
VLKTHEDTLERIAALGGNCLDAKICSFCPFASRCLPEFLKTPAYRPSQEERLSMALDALTRNSLLDDDIFPDESKI